MDALFTQFAAFAGNHIMLFGALFVALGLLIANEVHGNVSGGARLTPSDAVRLINDTSPVIIDVHNPGDFKRGHLLEARNIPFTKLQDRAKELEKLKDKSALVYCAMGSTAPQASEQLRKLGFASVFALKGGLTNWEAAGLPVTTK